MSEIPKAQRPTLPVDRGDSNFVVAEWLAEVLDRRPGRNVGATMSDIPKSQRPTLPVDRGDSNFVVAERLAEVLDRRPGRNLCIRLLAVMAKLVIAVAAITACVATSIAISAVGVWRSAGIDMLEVMSKKLTANTSAHAREPDHDALSPVEQTPAQRLPPPLSQHVANETEHRAR